MTKPRIGRIRPQRIDLPANFDRIDVVDQLRLWGEAMGSKRFQATVEEAVTEILMGRAHDPLAEIGPCA